MEQLTTFKIVIMVVCGLVALVTLVGIFWHASREEEASWRRDEDDWTTAQELRFQDLVMRRLLERRRQIDQQIRHRELELKAQEAK